MSRLPAFTKLALLLLASSLAFGATFTVKSAGGGDYTTIQACATAMAAGDTCTVFAGTYNEHVSLTAGGVASYKTLQVNGTDTVNVLDFTVNSHNKIIGFHIQNPSSPASADCVAMVNLSTDIYITSNVFTACGNHAMISGVNASDTASYVYIQSNTFSYSCSTSGAPNTCRGLNVSGDHFLIENNDISHVSDGIAVNGSHMVIRSNTMHDTLESDCGGHSGNCHIDFIESEPAVPTQYNLYETNTLLNNSGANGHGYLAQGDVCAGQCSNLIIRFNTGAHVGSAGIVDDNAFSGVNPGFNYVKSYNNTWVDFNSAPANQPFGITNGFSHNSTNAAEINDLFYYPESLADFNPYATDASTVGTFAVKNNLAYCTGLPCNIHGKTYGSGAFTGDPGNIQANPLFVSYASNNFRLSAGSPAIGSGASLTAVAVSDIGSGTSLVVNDASFFQDGSGLSGVSADCISATTTANHVCITAVNYTTNTLTLASSIIRSNGDPVWIYSDSTGRPVLAGGGPNIGAPANMVSVCAVAVCNGVANDTVAVQSVINGSSSGDVIFWTGTTKITSQITFPSNRTYTCTGTGGILAAAGIAVQQITLVSNPSNVTISNCVIDGGLVGGGIAIPGSVQGANIQITGNTFQHLRSSVDYGAVGVYAPIGINGSSINNNTFTDVYDTRTLPSSVCGAIWIWNSNNSTITGNTISQTCQAMHVTLTVPYATPATNLTISNNIITRSARYNIEIQGTIINNLIISGNNISDFEPNLNGQNAISAAVAGTGKQIINNVLYGPNQGKPTNQSSAIESEGTGFIISGNLAGHFGGAQSVLFTDTTWQTVNNQWCDMNYYPSPQNIIFFDTNGLPPGTNSGNTYTSNCWPAPVITTTATGITTTTATSGGTVTSNGGAVVTSQGVCYGTSANPTTSGTCTSNGTSTPFTSAISGLIPGTLYHYRAYAANSVGVGYGADKTLTTLSNGCVANSLGWVITGLTAIQDNLIGPLTCSGTNPWVFGDLAETGVVANMAPAAIAATPALGTHLAGTFSWAQGDFHVTSTVSQVTALAGQTRVIFTWDTIDGAATGRFICPISGVTATTITCGETTLEPSASGQQGYIAVSTTNLDNWTVENPNASWNYYGNDIAFDRIYYRNLNSTYLTYARQYEDIQWQWVLDHGYRSVAPRASNMLGQYFRVTEGHTERLPGLYFWINTQQPRWNHPDGTPNVDTRDNAYWTWDVSLGAKVDTDPTRHNQYCSWLTANVAAWNAAQYADGSWGENYFVVNTAYVSAPKSFTPPFLYGASPWNMAPAIKALESSYEVINDSTSGSCYNPTLAAATLQVIQKAVVWQNNQGRDTSNRGIYYTINSQSNEQETVVGTGTIVSASGTAVVGSGTNWLSAGYCDGTHFIGFINPTTVYKVASCASNTAMTLTVAYGLYGEAPGSAAGSLISFATAASSVCHSSATFCIGTSGDLNLPRTVCGDMAWLYSKILNATYLGWVNECLSAVMGGPTAGLTAAANIDNIALPCSGPACNGYVNDMVFSAATCGVPPCIFFGNVNANLGKNYGEAWGASAIDSALAYRLLTSIAPPVITSTSPITQGIVAVPYAYQFNATGTAPITWSGTSLPSWASLSPGGLLTGTPTVAAVSTLAITATNNGGATGPQNFSLTVVNGPTLPVITSTSPLTTGRFGVAYSYQFTATGTAPIAWSATGLPAWASLSTTGLLTGTPSAIATTVIAVTATNVAGSTSPTNFSLPITAVPPTITSTSPLPGGTTGIAYSYQFTATGGAPITWSGTGLPGWASLSSGGLLTGTPNAVAVTSMMITATNSAGSAGPIAFSLTVVSGGTAPTITTTSPITSGTIGVAYSFQFAANGTQPISWSGTGLPAWASLSAGGLLTGTPNAIATTMMSISAINSAGTAGPTTFSLTINGIVPTITSTSPLPGGTNGTSYSFQFTASGSTPITWGATGLPGWASLSSGGLLTGTPNANGATVIAVTATNSTGNSGPHNFSLTIIAGSVAPTITSTSPLPNAPYGVAYGFQFSANGTAPITWGGTGLPSWASLSSGGALTGTPNAVGVSTLHITATNGTGSDGPTTFSLTVPGVSPTIATLSPLPGGVVGTAYSQQFAATGTPTITWTGASLPAWASLSSSGLLTGTPNVAAVNSFTVTATNSAGSAGPTTFGLTIQDAPAAPTITTTSPVTTAHYGVAYSFQFAANGTAPITWSGTGLPSWASLSSAGFLTGTPDAVATTTIHVTATNGLGSAGPTDFSLPVVGVAPTITSTSPIPNGLVGASYSYQFTGTGTPNVLTWSSQSGLPPWASFSSTGLLTGVPPVNSVNTLMVTATNTAGSSASTPFSWTITGGTPPAVTCSPQSGLTPPNVTDVRAQTNMALLLTACTNSLTQTGTCTVVDVQRVVNAALGGACLIGP